MEPSTWTVPGAPDDGEGGGGGTPQDDSHGYEGYGLYLRTWGWLLLFTLLELGAVAVPLPRAAAVLVLVVLALLKGSLIVAYFMHLRFEKLQFVYAMLSPFIFTVILFGAIAPDAVFRVH